MNNLKEATQAIKSGDKAKGRTLLLRIVKTNPKHENAWLWLAVAVDDPQQKRDCLQKVLAINPHNQTARAGLKQLEQQERAKTEEVPQLQDILAPAPNFGDKPQLRKMQPQVLDQALRQDDPGQAEESVLLYLKLIGYIVMPVTIFGALLFMSIFAYGISSFTNIGPDGPIVSFSEAFLNLLSINGLRSISYFVGPFTVGLFLMSLIMGTWHILAVRRLPGGKQAGALQVRQVRTLQVNLPFERTIRACQDAVIMRDGRITSIDLKGGQIHAKTSVGMTTWGETILFHITALEDNLTEVVLMSKPTVKMALIDLGRNLGHVEAIKSYLKSIESG